jgi:hypothetical protein
MCLVSGFRPVSVSLDPKIVQIIADEHPGVQSIDYSPALATRCFGVSDRVSNDNPSKQS